MRVRPIPASRPMVPRSLSVILIEYHVWIVLWSLELRRIVESPQRTPNIRGQRTQTMASRSNVPERMHPASYMCQVLNNSYSAHYDALTPASTHSTRPSPDSLPIWIAWKPQ